MRTTVRAFLPALALLSLVIFCNPAAAGMIATPKADREAGEAREAALALLQARLSDAGPPPDGMWDGLKSLPTSDLLALSGSIDLVTRAGYHYYGLIALGICAAAFGIFAICYWGIYKHREHHDHAEHKCD